MYHFRFTGHPFAALPMKLCVIIVNYRTARNVLLGLPRLLDQIPGSDSGVLVVDNDSGDGSVEVLRAEVARRGWDEKVEVVASGRNAGFGAGNNFGIRYAAERGLDPEYVLLMNPDAYPEPGAVAALLDFMDGHPRAAVAGAAVRGVDGTRGASAFRSPSIIGEFVGAARIGLLSRLLSRWEVAPPAPEATAPSDWVSGCCMMLRRRALDHIGLFDERFFLYFEEVDLCRRARERGWDVHWVKEAGVVHDEGASTQIASRARRRPRYWFDSRRLYFLKAGSPLGLWAANGAWLAGACVHRLRHFTLQPADDPPHLLEDFVRWTILEPTSGEAG